MSDPTLRVDVAEDIVELGGVFRGRATRAGEVDDLASDSKQQARAVRLKLRWFTEGRGDSDRATVGELTLPLDQYGRVDVPFELVVPNYEPISYDGSLMRIRWVIEARVDIKRRRDPKLTIPVLVIPRNGYGHYERPHPLR